MLEQLTIREKMMIYQGLLCLVKSNSGVGCCNNDQGHPAYKMGKEGKQDHATFGDSPERNALFKMMHGLSVELCQSDSDDSSEIGDYIYSWQDFCRIAYEAYERAKKSVN
jgi:hypothetical protein